MALNYKKKTQKRNKNGKCNIIRSADENKLKIHCSKFLPLSEAEIQRLLHPVQANLEYFLAWFQSLQLPSTEFQSPLAPKFHAPVYKVRTQL
jgi:hypothetical protein